MRRVLLFVMLGIGFIAYSQSDTLYLKNGEKHGVNEITHIDNKFIYYKKFDSSGIMLIESKANKSLIDSCYTTKLNKNKNELEFYRNNTNLSQSDYKLRWVQFNINKFYKQKRVGHVFLGAAMASGAAYVLNPEELSAFGYIAGGLGLISFVIDINSYKWLKKASLEAKANSVSVVLKF